MVFSSLRSIPQATLLRGGRGREEKRKIAGRPLGEDTCRFAATERGRRLILTRHLGRRTARDAQGLIEKLNGVTAGHFQVTTNGFPPYFDAVETSPGTRVDWSQLIKLCGAANYDEHRYSPPRVIGAIAKPMRGNPDPEKISRSPVERQNLTKRMQMRRLTRLADAFWKKWEKLYAMLALYFPWYNFCRIHQTLRITPAMERGITNHVWVIRELFR